VYGLLSLLNGNLTQNIGGSALLAHFTTPWLVNLSLALKTVFID